MLRIFYFRKIKEIEVPKLDCPPIQIIRYCSEESLNFDKISTSYFFRNLTFRLIHISLCCIVLSGNKIEIYGKVTLCDRYFLLDLEIIIIIIKQPIIKNVIEILNVLTLKILIV